MYSPTKRKVRAIPPVVKVGRFDSEWHALVQVRHKRGYTLHCMAPP
jgi:hypothetical protein